MNHSSDIECCSAPRSEPCGAPSGMLSVVLLECVLVISVQSIQSFGHAQPECLEFSQNVTHVRLC